MPKDLGKVLEKRINKVNYEYRKDKLAVIKKEEVPIHVTRRGLVATLSTVDYTGAIKVKINDQIIGLGIVFDAKETKSKTSFPLSNIHQHQLEFLKLHEEIGSCSFLLIQFTSIHREEAFMVPINFIYKVWENARDGGKKSIKYDQFDKNWLVKIDNYLTNILNKEWKGSLEKMFK